MFSLPINFESARCNKFHFHILSNKYTNFLSKVIAHCKLNLIFLSFCKLKTTESCVSYTQNLRIIKMKPTVLFKKGYQSGNIL